MYPDEVVLDSCSGVEEIGSEDSLGYWTFRSSLESSTFRSPPQVQITNPIGRMSLGAVFLPQWSSYPSSA